MQWFSWRIFLLQRQQNTHLKYIPATMCVQSSTNEKYRDHGDPPPFFLKSCQNMMRTWEAYAKKRLTDGVNPCWLIPTSNKKANIFTWKTFFCQQAHQSAAYRIIVNKIREHIFSHKQMHCPFAEIVIGWAMYGDRSHLWNWSRWKPAAGCGHGAGVFLMCLLVVSFVLCTRVMVGLILGYCTVFLVVIFEIFIVLIGDVNSQIF